MGIQAHVVTRYSHKGYFFSLYQFGYQGGELKAFELVDYVELLLIRYRRAESVEVVKND